MTSNHQALTAHDVEPFEPLPNVEYRGHVTLCRWCDDSINDRKTFDACLDERRQLISLTGITAVTELCYDIERL